MRFAKAGIEALHEHVDSLIIVPNSKLMEVLGNDITVPEAFKAANGVLQGAVAGIAEVINVPGLINVDFADVKTVMSENGMAMMGSAIANGPDRARTAAERAIASPLLEDVDMSGARGVLVNITSSINLKLKEIDDVMECVQFAAEEATVIVGSVFDEAMGDELRVTVVATGLGATRKQSKPEVVYRGEEATYQRTGTDNQPVANPGVNYSELDTPAVMRRGRREQIDAMEKSGMDTLDIPSFLRKQAD
jgi:cell division protein FtsZ